MNQKDPEIVERFVELRAQGWTFARIAAELKTSQPTLISWSQKHQHRISNLRAIEMEELAEAARLSRRHFISSLAEDERRLREELARRDSQGHPLCPSFCATGGRAAGGGWS
jgi:orotate phosphoribosyltransferase-like protein